MTHLTDTSTLIARLAAGVYLLIWLTNLFVSFQTGGEEEHYAIVTRLTGPYWFGYWIYPVSFGLFPQLLWMKKIRKIKAMRMVTAFLFLFALYVEKIIILITSLHRDYVPSGWTMLPDYFVIYDWFVSLIIFLVTLTIVHFIKLKFVKAS
jgi:molybdopterin-containing oxidoreductase family membrane subunit